MIKSSNKPKVFVDADVIFAGAAAPTEHGASHVVLRMGEITLIDCISSEQAVKEPEARAGRDRDPPSSAFAR